MRNKMGKGARVSLSALRLAADCPPEGNSSRMFESTVYISSRPTIPSRDDEKSSDEYLSSACLGEATASLGGKSATGARPTRHLHLPSIHFIVRHFSQVATVAKMTNHNQIAKTEALTGPFSETCPPCWRTRLPQSSIVPPALPPTRPRITPRSRLP